MSEEIKDLIEESVPTEAIDTPVAETPVEVEAPLEMDAPVEAEAPIEDIPVETEIEAPVEIETPVEIEAPVEEATPIDYEPPIEFEGIEDPSEFDPPVEEEFADPYEEYPVGEEFPADEEVPTEEELPELPENIKVDVVDSEYAKNPYVQYGFGGDLPCFDFNSALSYLTDCGFSDNSLSQARERADESRILEQLYDPHKDGCRYCDFCGAELTGVEYEIISDGRERCNECSRTVINDLEEFKKVFKEVRTNIEAMFGIRIAASIQVKTMDARKLNKKVTKTNFTPTPGFDGRVLGVAINESGRYSLYVENQSPYLNAVATIAHELTHIWQYVNWNPKAIIRKYGKDMRLEIYEGMAKWVEIQYLYFINEPQRAYRELIATLQRDDEYGRGLRLYLNEYRLSKGVTMESVTPFFDKATPLHEF